MYNTGICEKMHGSRIITGLILVLSIMMPTSARAARQTVSIPRQTTVTLTFIENDRYPGRLTNMASALRQLQAFFDAADYTKGSEYSFIRDVLDLEITPKAAYVDTPLGYGYGINGAAVLLNKIALNAGFWDVDGLEKPLFQRVSYDPLRFDRTYDVYGVNLRRPNTDFVWRINPDYDGTRPRASLAFDPATSTATILLDYDDEIPPPSRKLSLAEKGQVLAANLKAIIGDRRLGVSVVPIASPADTVDVNAQIQVPVASAWKGGAMVYFFENIDRALWTSYPIQYWNLRNVLRVPKEYQNAFVQHNQILRWVYIAGVFSGNHEAGDVIDFVWRNSKWKTAQNAVTAFNQWSREVVGVSLQSGMHKWLAGMTENPSIVDHSLDKRVFTDNGRVLPFDNTYSPHDLALFYYHLATAGKQQGYYNSVIELLSTKTDILSMLKGYSSGSGIVVASKVGYFAPTSPDAFGHDVNVDGGLLTLPNGEQYAIAAMAFDAVPLQADVLTSIFRALLNVYMSS